MMNPQNSDGLFLVLTFDAVSDWCRNLLFGGARPRELVSAFALTAYIVIVEQIAIWK